MKKAIAVALAALSSSAVMAQNVTVYGIMDAGIQQYNNGSTSFTRALDNGYNTSRLGFKGTEDLGGGLKANFQLEAQVNPNTGSMGSTTVAANETFNREAWVGLSGGFGSVLFGRTDVTNAQNIDSMVSQFVNFGQRPIDTTGVELGGDQKSVVRYTTPTFGGLYAELGYASGNASGATTDTQAEQHGAMVGYTAGKFKAYVGMHKLGASTAVAERDFTVVGAAYDLGVASVGATYSEGDVSTTGDATSKSTVASIKVPLSNGVALHGVYGMSTNGAQASANESTSYVVGATKALSKRTTLYVAYTAVDNQANASAYHWGTSAPASAGLDTKATSIGINHVF
jgi:predicted porin